MQINRRRLGRFNPKARLVAMVPFNGLDVGDTVPRASYAKMRRWWRRGWVANEHVVSSVFADAPPRGLDDSVPDVGDKIVETVEETGKGWFRVTFSDGSEMRLRRNELADFGISGWDDA